MNIFGDMLPDFAIHVFITYCVVFENTILLTAFFFIPPLDDISDVN